MDERRMWTAEQLETIETFRSKDDASSDGASASLAEALSSDPELVQRLDCVLRWDARLTAAMRDVSVPPGLAEQILQSLDVSSQQPAPIPAAVRLNRRGRRGVWITAAAGIGVAAVLIMMAMFGRTPSANPDRLRSIALDRFTANQGSTPAGSIVTARSFPDGFPYSPDLFAFPETEWRRSADFDSAKAVAYEIPLGPGRKATLYVIRCRPDAPLPTRVPASPQMQTLGLAVSAWQGDGVVYVVVVDESAYRALFKSQSNGLT